LSEGESQIQFIRQGVEIVLPPTILNIMPWEFAELRATGEKNVDVQTLKSITSYNVRAFTNFQ